MAGQIGHQVFHHAHRAHAWAAATVGDAEGFVQVQVADIAAELAGGGCAHQGIHIGAIHINPAAVLVHQGAQLFDRGFKHAMGAGVGDHHGRQIGAVLLALGREVGHVHVAVFIALGDHHRHADHHGAGRVGAVRAAGDQADVAVALATGLVVGLDDEQAGVFALAAGIGLQADASVAGGGAQPRAQLGV